MAFSSSQLSLVRRLRGNFSEWNYRSATDDNTVQAAANYFNGAAAQFRVGDVVVSYGAGTPQVFAVAGNSGSVVTVTAIPGGSGGGGGTVNDSNWSGTDLSIANGGTGASTEAAARANLLLGSLATLNDINNANWTSSGADLDVVNGGTGASTAGAARGNLGLGTLATASTVDNTNWTNLGVPLTVANGGTNAITAGAARTNLGLGTLATASTVNNAQWSGTPLATGNGGTGATDIGTARDNLGLGDLAVLDKVSNALWDTPANAPLTVVNGGTGSTTPAAARAALGISTAGIEAVSLALTGLSTNFTTVGDGINRFVVTGSMNTMNLVSVLLVVGVVSSSSVTVQIRRRRSATGTDADMLSTKLTTLPGQRSSQAVGTIPAVINTANDDIGTGDVIYIDVDAISGTPQGGLVGLEFQLP